MDVFLFDHALDVRKAWFVHSSTVADGYQVVDGPPDDGIGEGDDTMTRPAPPVVPVREAMLDAGGGSG